MGNAIMFRMPSGVPGDISRRSQSVVEQVFLDPAKPFPGYGLPGKIVSGKFVPLEAGDAATVIYGFLVRPFPIQTANADGSGVSLGKVGDCLRRGWMTVKSNAGTPAFNGVVYARVATPSGAKVIGGVEAVADSTNTVIVARSTFKDAGDASGNVELEFNVA
jgi:hypothetical protein